MVWDAMSAQVTGGYGSTSARWRSCRCSDGFDSSKPAEQEVGVPQVQRTIDMGPACKVDEDSMIIAAIVVYIENPIHRSLSVIQGKYC